MERPAYAERKEYAKAVMETELQLHADNVNCFENEYYLETHKDMIQNGTL